MSDCEGYLELDAKLVASACSDYLEDTKASKIAEIVQYFDKELDNLKKSIVLKVLNFILPNKWYMRLRSYIIQGIVDKRDEQIYRVVNMKATNLMSEHPTDTIVDSGLFARYDVLELKDVAEVAMKMQPKTVKVSHSMITRLSKYL
jgi:hypothetical protein